MAGPAETSTSPTEISWRAPFENQALERLHRQSFAGDGREPDRSARVQRHSLGWGCAHRGSELVGFVNVPWDGGEHAFLVDLMVLKGSQRLGIGTALVDLARNEAANAGVAGFMSTSRATSTPSTWMPAT